MTTPIIKSKDSVLDWFETNGFSKFTLYRGHTNDAKNRVFCQDDANWSMEQSKGKLDTLFNWYDNKGDFYLFVTDSKTGTGGGFQTLISLYGSAGAGGGQSAAINGIPAGYVGVESVQTMIENAVLKLQLSQMQEQISGLQSNPGRDMSKLEGIMEKVLEDEGSGKEIAIGIRDMMRGFGMAGSKIAGNLMTRTPNPAGEQINPQPRRVVTKSKNTEGVALKEKDMDGRKFAVLFPQVKAEFPDASPQNVFAAIWDFYCNSDDFVKAQLKDTLTPLIEAQEEIPSPSPQNTEGAQNEG